MIEKHHCTWCGHGEDGGRSLVPGPVIYICSQCIADLANTGTESPSAAIREEIERDVLEGFKNIMSQINLGPLHDKYQRLIHVKFKEEAGSPTFQEVFSEFKKGVEAEVAKDDYQTRYDLAIAYHEMGLVEDAFREMLQSLRAALAKKDYDKAAEVMSALIYFHDDSARVIKGIYGMLGEAGIE